MNRRAEWKLIIVLAALVLALTAAEQNHIPAMLMVEKLYFNGETGGGKCRAGTEVLPDHNKARRIKASGSDQVPVRNYNLQQDE